MLGVFHAVQQLLCEWRMDCTRVSFSFFSLQAVGPSEGFRTTGHSDPSAHEAAIRGSSHACDAQASGAGRVGLSVFSQGHVDMWTGLLRSGTAARRQD